MDVSTKKSSFSEKSPGRETLTTRPEVSHSTPCHESQQSKENDHEWRRLEGSETMLRLKWRSASLSTAWHASETRSERKRKMVREILRMEILAIFCYGKLN
ncbi:hypothetical protein PanWU01x14_073390, partial [Parasponia andersonii]